MLLPDSDDTLSQLDSAHVLCNLQDLLVITQLFMALYRPLSEPGSISDFIKQ